MCFRKIIKYFLSSEKSFNFWYLFLICLYTILLLLHWFSAHSCFLFSRRDGFQALWAEKPRLLLAGYSEANHDAGHSLWIVNPWLPPTTNCSWIETSTSMGEWKKFLLLLTEGGKWLFYSVSPVGLEGLAWKPPWSMFTRSPSHWQDSGAQGAQLQLPPHCSGGEAPAGRCLCAMEPELVGCHRPGEQVTILPTCAVTSTLPTECLEETLQTSLWLLVLIAAYLCNTGDVELNCHYTSGEKLR